RATTRLITHKREIHERVVGSLPPRFFAWFGSSQDCYFCYFGLARTKPLSGYRIFKARCPTYPSRDFPRSTSMIAAEKTAEYRGCGEVMRLRSTTTGASCTQVAPAASASGCTTKSGKETLSLKPVMRRPVTIFERAANIDPRQIQAMTPPWALTSCTNLVT